MRWFLPLATVFASLVLAACESTVRQDVSRAGTELVGMPKNELLVCAGAPDATGSADGLEFLTYEATGFETRARSSLHYGFGWGAYGHRHFGGFSLGFPYLYDYDVESATCRATFELEEGRVRAVRFAGNGREWDRLKLCQAIVAPCMPPAAGQ